MRESAPTLCGQRANLDEIELHLPEKRESGLLWEVLLVEKVVLEGLHEVQRVDLDVHEHVQHLDPRRP